MRTRLGSRRLWPPLFSADWSPLVPRGIGSAGSCECLGLKWGWIVVGSIRGRHLAFYTAPCGAGMRRYLHFAVHAHGDPSTRAVAYDLQKQETSMLV